MKKICAAILSFAMAAACCSGCASGSGSGKNSQAPVNDGPIDIAKLPTDNMVIRSRLYDGDSARIAEKVKAALDSKDNKTVIAFLGDSITQGSSASWENQYTNQFAAWWKENISENADFINAGIGATDSYLAVHRADTDVLSYDPDIIFIEFINDGNNDFYKSTMESLVRKCLAAPSQPAVVLIEMTQENGTCPQDVHTEVAEYYNVPVISYHDAVLPEVNAGTLSWQSISPDNIHPNDDGHKMLGKLLTEYVGEIKDNISKLKTTYKAFDPESKSITGDKYFNAKLLGKDSPELTVVSSEGFDDASTNYPYNNGWAASSGGTIKFEMEFQNLGILFNKMTSGGGTAFVKIDGIDVAMVDADFSGGWGSHASNQEIICFEEKGVHTVTITVNSGRRFEILRLMVS